MKSPIPHQNRKYSLFNGLGRSLGIAFLLFAILPMAVSGIISYRKAYDNLREAAEIALKTSAVLKTREIQAYFERMLTNLRHQANTDSATRFMESLVNAQGASGQSADQFVRSHSWSRIDDEYGTDLKKIRTAYRYDDVFMINKQGDILFSVTKEEDFGINLFSPPYDQTKFAAAAHLSLSTGRPAFSDYEQWEPSGDKLFGFITDVIVDKNGDIIGVMAFQFPIGPINAIMQAQAGLGKTAETYLVGPDFSLRSNSILDPEMPLVSGRITTYQTQLLKQHWEYGKYTINNASHEAALYEGPHGNPVLGIHNGFMIQEISFGVIAEIEQKEAFSKAAGLKRDMIITTGLTGLIAFIVSLVLVGRIVNPVLELASGATRVKDGDFSRKIDVHANNEMGDLTHAFNAMVDGLKAAKDDAQLRDWFKTGQMALGARINGILELSTIGRTIVTFLADYLNADVGVIYLATDENRLRRIGSYALANPYNFTEEFEFGQGLVGQAALEKKPTLLSDIPDNHLAIQTGLGEIRPVSIIVNPFIYNDQVVGVLELGATRPFSENALLFLDRVGEQIAVNIRTLLAHIQVRELLDQTRVQAAALQNSEAELKVQEEELRQTNVELEEQSQRLEEQKNDIEQKNQELVLARRQIEEKANDFERASQYKSQFLANMSHELRTPLNSILILSRLLADNREGSLTDDQVQSAATIHSSGKALLVLINDVLDLSKIEAGKMTLQLDRMNLQSFGEDLLASCRAQIEEKGLTLTFKIQPDLPPEMVTDRQRVEQVLRNFISNALKFTHKGGITLTIRRPADSEARKLGLPADQTIGFCVEDTGIGIPKEKQSVIFDAFQQADGTTSRLYGGTGLGLSISKELAILLGGQIDMSSVPEKGSTFVLYLPEKTTPADAKIADRLDQPESAIEEDTLAASPVQIEKITPEEIIDDRKAIFPGDRSILLIEDDPSFLKILRDLSREQGFKCLVAENGEVGLQLAEYYSPSAIILDIGLPGIDGWTVMSRLKENLATRHIPVHVISATDRAMEALKMGALAFLTKPVAPEDLSGAFSKLKYIISKPVKDLLVVDNDTSSHKIISEIIGNGDVTLTFTESAAGAFKALGSKSFDGMIIDLDLPDMPGTKLMEKIRNNDTIGYFPIIVYTGHAPTAKEKALIDQYAETTIFKDSDGDNKLLDETTLFLHRVEANLPEAQQKIIRMIHDKESLFANRTVLVVDDDMRNVYSLKKILEAKTMKVLVGKSGIEALERLRETPEIDIILMDVMMPEMDGYEAMQKIRQRPQYKNLPIIALTAKAMKGDRAKCIEAGASDYLAKPVDVDRLLSMMRVWLYGRD